MPRYLWRNAIWPESDIQKVKNELACLANTIRKHVPVTVVVPPGTPYLAEAQQLFGTEIEYTEIAVDDIWIRDTGPLFVQGSDQIPYAVDANFNGWGYKQPHCRDTRLARNLARYLKLDVVDTWLTTEGGAIEFDGCGTALVTDCSILNDNRNPGKTALDVEDEFRRVFGVHKVIWVPGQPNLALRDITDGHIDFYARFARPGVVAVHIESKASTHEGILTRQIEAHLSTARDARGVQLEIATIQGPVKTRRRNHDFAASYLNFLVVDGAVIAPEFGHEQSDAAAFEALRTLFPTRVIEQIPIDAIAAGGGGIHCATLNQPSLSDVLTYAV